MAEHNARYRTPRTRQQRWAQRAFECVNTRVAGWDQDIRAGEGDTAGDSATTGAQPAQSQRKEYRSFARAFPTLIHVSGLAQATAFASVKSKGMRHEVLKDLDRVMRQDQDRREDWTVCAESRAVGSAEYRLLTREAIAAALWLKRYAEALIEPEDTAESRPANADAGAQGE